MIDPREELLATVASLYYNMNRSQSEIASRLEISSPTVSRLIREAREKGIVEIHIRIPVPRDLELERDRLNAQLALLERERMRALAADEPAEARLTEARQQLIRVQLEIVNRRLEQTTCPSYL